MMRKSKSCLVVTSPIGWCTILSRSSATLKALVWTSRARRHSLRTSVGTANLNMSVASAFEPPCNSRTAMSDALATCQINSDTDHSSQGVGSESSCSETSPSTDKKHSVLIANVGLRSTWKTYPSPAPEHVATATRVLTNRNHVKHLGNDSPSQYRSRLPGTGPKEPRGALRPGTERARFSFKRPAP